MLLLKKRFFGMIVLFMLILNFGACSGGDDGDRGVFWAQNPTTEKYYQLRADLLAEGKHCKVYVEQGLDLKKYNVPASSLEEMAEDVADEYDNGIYQIMIDTFSVRSFTNPVNGKPADNVMEIPDSMTDGDGKLTILILDIKGASSGDAYVAGYFTPLNLFKNDSRDPYLKYSNECDMIYLNIYSGSNQGPGSLESNKTLAHEMQHMMCFATDVLKRRTGNSLNQMDLWINEGLSSAAEYVYSGQHSQERINHYNNYTSPKTDIPYGNNFYVWGEKRGEYDYILDEYATVYLFFQWLRLQSSPPNGSLDNYNIYEKIIGSTSYDQDAVVNALKGKGNYVSDSTLSWGTVLLDWFAANLLRYPITAQTPKGAIGGEPKYGYMGEPELSTGGRWVITTATKEIQLYPGEGVYSSTPLAGAISYPGSGSYIRYAGVNIDFFSSPQTIYGDGTVNKSSKYANGLLITYNIRTLYRYDDNYDPMSEKGYIANIVSMDTNFSLMGQSAFSIQSAKAMTYSNQDVASSNQAAVNPKKPHAISMGDMLRMNGHKDSGYDITKIISEK